MTDCRGHPRALLATSTYCAKWWRLMSLQKPCLPSRKVSPASSLARFLEQRVSHSLENFKGIGIGIDMTQSLRDHCSPELRPGLYR